MIIAYFKIILTSNNALLESDKEAYRISKCKNNCGRTFLLDTVDRVNNTKVFFFCHLRIEDFMDFLSLTRG